MRLSLPPELKKFIDAKVEAGQYASAEDVVREALQDMRTREVMSAKDIAELRRDLAGALDELDRGESAEFTAKDIQALGRKVLAGRRASAKRQTRRRRAM